jgi:hypothetical protein
LGEESSRDVAALEEALCKGYEVGLREDELEHASVVLARQLRRASALQGLFSAWESQDITTLRGAIAEAEEAGLSEKDLQGARLALIAALQVDARMRLSQAAAAQEIDLLEHAIANGKKLGLQQEEFAVAEHSLAKAMARRSLEEASSSRNMASLEMAIRQAESLSLNIPELDRARVVLEEERKEAARAQLAEAIAVCEIGFLQEAIEHGKGVGLEIEDLVEAEDLLASELRKADARKRLAEAARSRQIQALEMAICNGYEAGLCPEEFTVASSVLAQEIHRAAALQGLFSAWESEDIATLQAAIAEAGRAGLNEKAIEGARVALVEALKVDARKRLAQAMRTQDIAPLEAAISHGMNMGLQSHELQDGRDTLADAIRTKWRGILTREPIELGLSALLSKLEDILQMGFHLDFIEEFVLQRISDGGGGQTPQLLAKRLQELRLFFIDAHVNMDWHSEETFRCGIDEPTKQAVEAAFWQGIEVLASDINEICGWSNALIWLDLAPPMSSERLCGIRSRSVPIVQPGEHAPLDGTISSDLLNIELRSISESPISWTLSAFDANGVFLWSCSLQDRAQRSEKKKIISILHRDMDSLALWSFRLNLARMSSKVAALGIFSETESASSIESASVCLNEIPQSESTTLDSLKTGKAPPRGMSGSPRLSADLTKSFHGNCSNTVPHVVICRDAASSVNRWLFL